MHRLARVAGALIARGRRMRRKTEVLRERHLELLRRATGRMAKTRGGAGGTKVRFTPTAEERERIFMARLERAGAVYVRFARLLPLLMGALGLLAVALAASVLPGSSPGRLMAGMAMLVVLVLAPVLVVGVPALRRKVVFRGGGEETVAVDGGGVEWETAERGRVAVRWSDMEAVEERGGVLLFVPRRGVEIAVPTRALDDGRTLDRLRETARRHLGGRARL